MPSPGRPWALWPPWPPPPTERHDGLAGDHRRILHVLGLIIRGLCGWISGISGPRFSQDVQMMEIIGNNVPM